MKNLAIIGASYLQLPLIKKAKEMGYVTHVFAWKANDVGEKEADYFYPISITEVDAIVDECNRIGVCGICSIATDLGNYTVNYVANKLGLCANSMESIKKSTNKFLMREAFVKNGDPIPQFYLVDSDTKLQTLDLSYPVIVKPTDRSGSRGIYKLESNSNLAQAVDEAISESFEKKALIEEYIDGLEYSVEGISYQGQHHILAITEKKTTGAPHFIERGHIEPADIDEETEKRIRKVVIHALDTLEIKNSASHSEIKIDSSGQIKIIEIGSRMGGDGIGSHLVYYSTGIDFTRAVIQVACGMAPDLSPVRQTCKSEIRFILTKGDVEEYERIKDSDKVLDVLDDVHENLVDKVTDSSNRAGAYVISLD